MDEIDDIWTVSHGWNILLKLNALHHNHTYGWNYTNCDNEVHEWRQHGWLKFPIWMKFNNMDESDFAYAIDHINEIWQQDLTHGW
jgi:hypothetical protein